MTKSDPATLVLRWVLGPPIEWVGRRAERAARRRVPDRELPRPPRPDLTLPALVVAAIVVGGLAERLAGADDPHPAGRRAERAEPVTDAAEDPLAEALEALEVDHPPVPPKRRVRAQYRSLALETHPDQGGSVERFKDVREAWETVDSSEELSDSRQDMEVTQA